MHQTQQKGRIVHLILVNDIRDAVLSVHLANYKLKFPKKFLNLNKQLVDRAYSWLQNVQVNSQIEKVLLSKNDSSTFASIHFKDSTQKIVF